jgi:hypothetical protein
MPRPKASKELPIQRQTYTVHNLDGSLHKKYHTVSVVPFFGSLCLLQCAVAAVFLQSHNCRLLSVIINDGFCGMISVVIAKKIFRKELPYAFLAPGLSLESSFLHNTSPPVVASYHTCYHCTPVKFQRDYGFASH